MATSSPCRVGSSSAAHSSRVGCAGRASIDSDAIGTSRASDFKKARAGFGFSTTKRRNLRATASVPSGSTRSGAMIPRRFGSRYKRPDISAEGIDADTMQHVGQPNERQADERRRIVAFDGSEECDPERLDLHRTGAVERSLAREIGVDLRSSQRAERAAYVHRGALACAAARVEQCDTRVEHHRLARKTRQELARAFLRAGLADELAFQIRYLIRADDERVGELPGNALRLGVGEPQ